LVPPKAGWKFGNLFPISQFFKLLIRTTGGSGCRSIEIKCQSKSYRIGKWISRDTGSGRNEVGEIQTQHIVFQANTHREILPATLVLIFIKITQSKSKLIIINIFCSDGSIDRIELAVERFEPAAYDALIIIVVNSFLTYGISAINGCRISRNQ